MVMNIRQLEAFKAIMEVGGFTRAAERLNLSQPAVSKLINLLERQCGFALFKRNKNGVTPTAEAEMLYSEVVRVFLGVESVEARAKAIKNFDFGEIDMVTFPSLGTHVLPKIIASFLSNKEMKVNLLSRNSWLLVDLLATQGVDVGFGMLATERPGINFVKLCTMEAVCVLPPGHRLANADVIHPKDLENESFVSLIDEDRAQFEIDRIFIKEGVTRNVILKVQLTEACCSFVSAGVGVAIVDPLSTVGFRDEELIVKPFQPAIIQTIWVITPSFRQISLGTKALIDHVGRELSKKIVEIDGYIREKK
ncbi:LysR family transcriptional regulator [Pseudochrobactrum sp. MP213Fo]|uniref:LysR family transcriptional regulator n=1 Tax=Pseudochrobactrum sp. MP213Fo TaxID=3022250 RepID=UPI003B9E82FA